MYNEVTMRLYAMQANISTFAVFIFGSMALILA